MPFIYHGVPADVRGTTLYPLNHLRDIYPDLFEREIAKYDDHPQRRLLPETRLPVLNRLWNDVIHTAPIHPHLLYRAWIERGAFVNPDCRFFQIPVDRVAMHTAGWMVERNVTLIDWNVYTELTTVPAETLAWYERLVAQGKHGADFVGVPHVLVTDQIDIAGLAPIRWSDPVTRPGNVV